jgi:CBS domain-containing protein
MVQEETGCVVVVNARGQAQGVLTEKDFVPHDPPNPFKPDSAHRLFGRPVHKHGLETLYREARVLTAGAMMHPLTTVLAEDDAVGNGIEAMLRHDSSHLPVLRGHRAVGSVSRHDLLKAVLAVAQPAEAMAA